MQQQSEQEGGAQQRQVHLHGLASARRREGRQNPVDLSNNEDGVGGQQKSLQTLSQTLATRLVGQQKSLQTHATRLGAPPGWDFSRGFVAVDVALKTFGGLSERSLGLVSGGLSCTKRPRRDTKSRSVGLAPDDAFGAC